MPSSGVDDEGVYVPLVNETTSVSIFGGYESTGWTRDIQAHPTVIRGDEGVLLIPGAGSAVAFEGLTLERATPYAGVDLMSGIAIIGATAAMTVARNTIRAGEIVTPGGNCFALYLADNDGPVTVLDNDLRCGVAVGYCRGIHIRNSTVTAVGNIIEGGAGATAAVSAVGVMVAGDTSRVRLVNNLIVGGRGADVAGVRIDGDVSMTDIVLVAHNVIVGGFNVNSLRTTGIAVDQTAHAVVVNNIIDGGRGVLSRGLYLTPNLLTDDRRVVLLHNDIWGLGQTHPAGNDVADWGVRELNACGWEDCQESGGNFSVDPMRVEPYGADVHLRPGSPCVDRGIDVTRWYPAAVVRRDIDP